MRLDDLLDALAFTPASPIASGLRGIGRLAGGGRKTLRAAPEGIGKAGGAGKLGKLDESLKSFNLLGKDEQRIVTRLLNEGKNIKLIPETPNAGKMYDFWVDGVPTELKTLNGNNINTLVTKVGDALKQIDGSGQIIYDISKAGFTSEQMAEINARLVSKYGEQVLKIINFVK